MENNKWYYKEFTSPKEVTLFLNKLLMLGVRGLDIKVGVSGSSNWATPVVWYLHDKEIE